MNKIIAGLILLLALVVIAVYIFIPSSLKISSATIIQCNPDAAFRVMADPINWQKWATGTAGKEIFATNETNKFVYRNDTFSIASILHNALKINITNGAMHATGLMLISPILKDSIIVQWECNLPTSANPFTKIKRYQQAVEIKNSITDILKNLKDYLGNQANVYGSVMKISSTKDTLLVALKTSLPAYPANSEIYATINSLLQFAHKKGALETAPPMINITKVSDHQFDLMGALPVNSVLNNEGEFLFKKLIPGNFLVTEVKGGDYTVNNALKMMQAYINDYGKIAVAIPFESLITDRSKEADTAKWVTKIYFPIVR